MIRKILLAAIISCIWLQLPAQRLPDQKYGIPDSILLSEVTVSGVLPLSNKNILNLYQSKNFSSIDDITARIGGISMIRRGAYAMEPQIGGFSAGQINLTIDGMRMFGACTDKMDPVTSYIEPSNLNSIKVSHGTGACETGCNIGGAVELSLRKPEIVKNSLSFSPALGYESVSGGKNVQLTAGSGIEKWTYALTGVYRNYGNYTDGTGQTVQNSGFEKINLHAIVTHEIDTFNTVRTDFLYDLARNVGYPALPMDVGRARAFLAALEYNHTKAFRFKGKLYFNTVYHLMDDSKRDSIYYLKNDPVQLSDTVFMRMDMPGTSNTFGAYAQTDINAGSKNKLFLKVENYTNHSLAEMTMYMHYAGSPPQPPMYMQTWPDIIRNVTGIYVKDVLKVNRSISLGLDGRMDLVADIPQNNVARGQFAVFDYVVPDSYVNLLKGLNGSLDYTISDHLRSGLSLGYAERIPTITEKFGFYLYNAYDGYDYIGNPLLETEKSWFTSVNLSFFSEIVKANLVQNFSWLHDYIMGQTDTTLQQMNLYAKGIRSYSNYSGAQIFSTNLQVFITPVRFLTLFTSVSYTWGALDNNEPLPLIPPLSLIGSAVVRIKKFSVQAESIAAMSQKRINKEYGETVTPGFAIINMKGSFNTTINDTSLEFSVGITNLLDKAYYEHLDWGKIYRPGRSIDLFAKLSF